MTSPQAPSRQPDCAHFGCSDRPDPSHVYPATSGTRRLPAASGCMARAGTRTTPDQIIKGQGLFALVWQVLGSNQRRLSRRFYRTLLLSESYADDLRLCVPRRDSGPPPSAMRPCVPGPGGAESTDGHGRRGQERCPDRPRERYTDRTAQLLASDLLLQRSLLTFVASLAFLFLWCGSEDSVFIRGFRGVRSGARRASGEAGCGRQGLGTWPHAGQVGAYAVEFLDDFQGEVGEGNWRLRG